MRRLFLLIGLVALVLAPGASAQFGDRLLQAGGEAVALKDGRGLAILRSRQGVALGKLARGRVTVVDLARGAETEVDLSGCEKTTRPRPRVTVCTGRRITFSILKGAWRVRIRGVRINASAVLRGSVTLQGTAGTYRLGGGEWHPWPAERRTFLLGR